MKIVYGDTSYFAPYKEWGGLNGWQITVLPNCSPRPDLVNNASVWIVPGSGEEGK